MKTVVFQTKRALSAILIAAQLLSVSAAEAGILDYFTGSVDVKPSESVATAPAETKPAPRPAKPRARLPVLGNGDADGIMDDFEKEAFKNKQTKAEDADEIGQYTVTDDQPLYSGGGADARVVGVVKKDEVFTVTLPGERYSRVRLKDGNTGFIDKTKVVPEGQKEPTVKVVTPPAPTREQPTVKPQPKRPVQSKRPAQPNHKSEAVCDICIGQVDLPNAIDQKQIGGIGKIRPDLIQNHPREQAKTTAPSAFPANGRTSTKIARLIAASRYQAVAKRVPARYLWRRLGRAPRGGNVSKGKCWAAVKDALVQAGIFKTRPGTEAAKDAGRDLRRAGMNNVMPSLRQSIGGDLRQLALKAPIGSVLVYEGGSHGYGHIEIKTANQQYCSDFCQVTPVNKNSARRLIGIYTL